VSDNPTLSGYHIYDISFPLFPFFYNCNKNVRHQNTVTVDAMTINKPLAFITSGSTQWKNNPNKKDQKVKAIIFMI
jgi:hypothetical protein